MKSAANMALGSIGRCRCREQVLKEVSRECENKCQSCCWKTMGRVSSASDVRSRRLYLQSTTRTVSSRPEYPIE